MGITWDRVVEERARLEDIDQTANDDNFGMISARIRKEFGIEISRAFEVICDHPEFTAEQVANKLGKTSRTVENYIAKLKKAGFIERKGPKRGGHWQVIGRLRGPQMNACLQQTDPWLIKPYA